MSQGIIIEAVGGPEVLRTINYELADPKADEIQIQHTAIEVNYIDIYHRTGVYPLMHNPKIPGVSAVGKIIKIGSNVNGFDVGDRVGYATATGGAYSKTRNIDNQLVFALPKELDDKTIASCMLKALTAHYLACRVYIVRPSTAILIHAAAGGVGKLLSQWCNSLGAYVIGTVGSDEKKQIALDNGCHLAINYNTEDWVAKIKEVTKNIGVNAVYDSVGLATFDKSLDCLMNMGMMIHYGNASGKIPPIDSDIIAKKSLFYTRPSLFHYKSHRMELLLSCNEVFSRLISGELKVVEPQEFNLTDAGKAHELLESRQSTGSIILIT